MNNQDTSTASQRPDGTPSYHAVAIRRLLDEQALNDFFRAAWDEVLVPICDANANDFGFVQNHMAKDYPAQEWRFQGSLGFGGKFRSTPTLHCRVDCYPEDETPARRETITKANAALEALRSRFIPQPA